LESSLESERAKKSHVKSVCNKGMLPGSNGTHLVIAYDIVNVDKGQASDLLEFGEQLFHLSLLLDVILSRDRRSVQVGVRQLTSVEKDFVHVQYIIGFMKRCLLYHINLKVHSKQELERVLKVQCVPFFFAYFLVNLFLQLETNMVM
jgi:hypothetical protein